MNASKKKMYYLLGRLLIVNAWNKIIILEITVDVDLQKASTAHTLN